MGADSAFDPLAERFIAQAERPEGLSAVRIRELPPFLRTLLVSDGTVTRFIETYRLEPVETVRIDQAHFALQHDHAWLDAATGARVVLRRVFLRGTKSATVYAYATALIALERMPKSVLTRLESQGQSLGEVLTAVKIETRRETLWYGWEHDVDVPEPLLPLAPPWLTRAYRIFHRSRPIALVTERFPGALEADEAPLPGASPRADRLTKE